MIASLYKLAYRTTSWLSDLSGGLRIFVRWKLALAALILGFSSVSFTACRPMCYEPAHEPPTEQEEGTDDSSGDSNNEGALSALPSEPSGSDR